jgi:protein O-mannosyl-transferase
MFAVGIAMALLTSRIEASHVIGEHYASGDWSLSIVQRVLIAGRAIAFYVTKLVLPLELTFTYPRWDVSAAQMWQWLFVVIVLAATAALWMLRTRIGRAPLVAWLIYIGVLVPALGFFDVYPMRYSFVADHFQYHASPALIALIVGGAVLGFRRLSKRPDPGVDEQSPTPYVASGFVLLVLGALTFLQARIYADPVTLWRDTVTKNNAAWMAHHNLGIELTDLARAYQRIGDEPSTEHSKDLLNQAVGHLQMAVQLRPSHDVAIMHWGRALLAQGKDQEAMRKFDEALVVNPQNVEALTNRAFMLQKSGNREEAFAAYRAALDECEKGPAVGHPRCGHIARLLGEAYEQAGSLDEAEAAFARAVRLAPTYSEAHYSYGMLLARRAGGMTPEQRRTTLAAAADQFLAILRRDPNHQDAQISLALLMIESGNLQGAQRELIQAARINRDAPRLMEAAKLFDAAVKNYEASTRPSTTQSTTQPSTTQSSTQPSSIKPATAQSTAAPPAP